MKRFLIGITTIIVVNAYSQDTLRIIKNENESNKVILDQLDFNDYSMSDIVKITTKIEVYNDTISQPKYNKAVILPIKKTGKTYKRKKRLFKFKNKRFYKVRKRRVKCYF